MTIETSFPAAHSARLPSSVVVQPREFEFEDLESVPQYWFAGNPILTHIENTFSIMIPPGERFFIRSVRRYQDRVTDPKLRELIRAFVQQEALHSRAHNQFNDSIKAFGIDVERERAYADRVMNRLEKILPAKVCLGATVFLEHLTAVGAHTLFTQPLLSQSMPAEMNRFWRWHAAEELEHKAVAFDLFREVGGGYLLRVFSAFAALLLLALPFNRVVRRMLKEDGVTITAEMRTQAREINRQLAGPQLRMIGRYFKPGFHPWDCDDEPYLAEWYASLEASGASQ